MGLFPKIHSQFTLQSIFSSSNSSSVFKTLLVSGMSKDTKFFFHLSLTSLIKIYYTGLAKKSV